jgi:hypothetical protein
MTGSQGPVKKVLGALARLEDEAWTSSSYDAMVLAFLKGEWSRWRLADRGDIRLITEPDLTDATQNLTRRRLLQAVRGVVLQHIPEDTRWYEIRHLSGCHFWMLHHIHRSDWSRYSDTNELIKTALARPERLRQESASWGSWRPILWGHNRSGPFTIIEGNHRLTALAGAAPARQQNVRMVTYVGISSRPCEWHRPDAMLAP